MSRRSRFGQFHSFFRLPKKGQFFPSNFSENSIHFQLSVLDHKFEANEQCLFFEQIISP